MTPQQVRKILENLPDNELVKLSPLSAESVFNQIARPSLKTPHPRQQEFLSLTCEEALYGGAAGGGKTEGLLMWLAEGAHLPGYSGILFRRTFAQLAKSNDSPLTKSQELFPALGGVYKASDKTWTFPSGARVEFGHLPHESSVHDYQGGGFHRVAFDELTQFSEVQYTYLFSRVRKRTGFPLAMGVRAASNPGGPGHGWVKARFVSPEAEQAILRLSPRSPSPRGMIFWMTEQRAFVPARVADNPALDIDDYLARMAAYLPPVLRERMLNGDWSIREDARISPEWLRYWSEHFGQYQVLDVDQSNCLELVHPADCLRFMTVDCAGTSEEVAKAERTGIRSRSVASVWDYHHASGKLFWRDAAYGLWEFPELLDQIKKLQARHRTQWIGIEDEKTGRAAIQLLRGELPVRALSHEGKDKLARAQPAILLLETGKVFLPRDALWRNAAEAELLGWTGHPKEPADFIDTLSYAARHATQQAQPIIYESLGDHLTCLIHWHRSF